MYKITDFKLGNKIIFTKDFVNYYVLQSSCGWAVTPISAGTKGEIKELKTDSLVIELDEPANKRTIWAFKSKNEDEVDFLSIICRS